jgi:hypothetical protein
MNSEDGTSTGPRGTLVAVTPGMLFLMPANTFVGCKGGEGCASEVNLFKVKVNLFKIKVDLFKIEVIVFKVEANLFKFEVSLFTGEVGQNIFLLVNYLKLERLMKPKACASALRTGSYVDRIGSRCVRVPSRPLQPLWLV